MSNTAQRIKIKQFDDRVAAHAVHFGGAPERRRLEIGEVVEVDDEKLLDAMLGSGKIELTRDEITRPLDYATHREARLCSPNFRPSDADEEAEAEEAKERVLERLRSQTKNGGAVAGGASSSAPRQRKRAVANGALDNGTAG